MGSQPSFWDAQAPVVDQIVELQHSPSGNLHHRSGTNLWQFDGGRNHQDELRSNCPQLMKMKLIGLHEVASVPLSAICVTSLDKCLPQFPDACAESFLPKKKKTDLWVKKTLHCTRMHFESQTHCQPTAQKGSDRVCRNRHSFVYYYSWPKHSYKN